MRILVVILEYRGVEALTPITLKAAEGGHPVTLLQLRDAHFSDKVCNKLTQDGWLGAHSSETVSKAVSEDYKDRFNEACKVVKKELLAAGVDTECMTREGDLVNTVLRVAEEVGDVELIILGKPAHNWLTRWFKDFDVRLLCDRAPMTVQIVPLSRD